MANISSMFTEFQLPDGSIASSVSDIDKYIKASGDALAGDYSPEFLQRKKVSKELEQKAKDFTAFINEYKKRIWK